MYNPFEFLQGDKYDPFNFQDCEDINNISQILKSCETYDHISFDNKIKTLNSSNIYYLLYLIIMHLILIHLLQI